MKMCIKRNQQTKKAEKCCRLKSPARILNPSRPSQAELKLFFVLLNDVCRTAGKGDDENRQRLSDFGAFENLHKCVATRRHTTRRGWHTTLEDKSLQSDVFWSFPNRSVKNKWEKMHFDAHFWMDVLCWILFWLLFVGLGVFCVQLIIWLHHGWITLAVCRASMHKSFSQFLWQPLKRLQRGPLNWKGELFFRRKAFSVWKDQELH